MCFSGDILCGGNDTRARQVLMKKKVLATTFALLADYKLKTKPSVARL